MILFRESVRVVQFTKKSRSFVRSFVRSVVFPVAVNHSVSRSFVRSVVFPVAVNHSVSRSDSLPPSAPRSRSRIANASRVVQTHFRPPPLVLVLVRECQPSRSDSLPPSFTTFKRITKSRFTIVQWCKWLSINTTLTQQQHFHGYASRVMKGLLKFRCACALCIS